MSYKAKQGGKATMPLKKFCNACFSLDRKLMPIGNLLDVFYSLFENRNSNPVFRRQVSLCWECLAILKRVRDFKRNVTSVQNFMNNCYGSQSVLLPQSLSKLAIVQSIWDTDIKYDNNDKDEAKVEEEVCREDPPDTEMKAGETVPIPFYEPTEIKQEVIDDDDNNDNSMEIDDADDWQNVDIEHEETLVRDLTKKVDLEHKETLVRDLRKKVDLEHKEKKPKKLPVKQKKPKKSSVKKIKYTCKQATNNRMKKLYSKYPINDVEREQLLEEDRKDKLFLAYPHRCEKCMYGTRRKKFLLAHNQNHEKGGRFHCNICSCKFKEKLFIRHHMKYHYIGLRCNLCDYKTASTENVRRHIHENHMTAVKCRKCDASFSSTREFHKHYNALHKHFICDHCGKSFLSRRTIKIHMVSHVPLTCCQRQFTKAKKYHEHRAKRHRIDPPEMAYCVECDKQFDSVLQYRKHIENKHTRRPKPKKPSKTKEKQKFPCPDPNCGRVYGSAFTVREHHNFAHLHQYKYKCTECDKCFPRKSSLKVHTLYWHKPGWRPPKNKICAECGRGFSTNAMLINHMRTHTGERPYACDHCDAKFAQQVAMKLHVKNIHLKEKRPKGKS